VGHPYRHGFVPALGSPTAAAIASARARTTSANDLNYQGGISGVGVTTGHKATDSSSSATLTYSASGLPAGLSINSSTGLISGTPTTAATSSVTVTCWARSPT